MIVGILDRIWASDNNSRFTIGGWAYFKDMHESGKIFQVEIRIPDLPNINIKQTHRGDCFNNIEVGFEFEVGPAELTNLTLDNFKIVACHDGIIKNLEIWKPLAKKIREKLIDIILSKDCDNELLNTISTTVLSKRIPDDKSILLETSVNMTLNKGTQSLDGNVIVGKRGRLFLYKGTNNIHSQYESRNGNENLGALWTKLVNDRNTFCNDNNVKFLQIIIPEKQSVYPHGYPSGPISNTPLYDYISKWILKNSYFLDINSKFKSLVNKSIDPFLYVDSHLSLEGVKCILSEIFLKLNLEISFNNNEVSSDERAGDLGKHFFSRGAFTEKLTIPKSNFIVQATTDPTLIEEENVEGHIGTKRVWINNQAPFNISVIVFGNSFFERGEDPLALSYWFSRLFKNFEFHWTPHLSKEAVLRKRFDIVICQTIERFLPHVPDS